MSARLRIGAAVAVAVGLAGVALLLLFRAAAPAPEPLPPAAAGMAARGTLSPRSYTFGEQLFARVEVLLDRRTFDPDDVTVDAQFAPFVARGQPTVEREDFSDLTRLRYVIELECLQRECVPDSIEKPIQLSPLLIEHDGTPVEEVSWPRFSIVARVRQASISAIPGSDWRASALVRPPTYRVDAAVASAALAVGALVLYGVAALLLVAGSAGLTRRWRRLRLTPLERALAGLERATAAGAEADQRLALDRLADELRSRGAGDLSVAARRLAWAEGTPAAERTQNLSHGVRELLHGRSNGRG